jgi:hypothetical protein
VEYNTDAHFITRIAELCNGAAHGPIGIFSADGVAADRLSSWWGSRSIPQSRPYIANSLNTLGLSTPLELPEFNHGLSLSDQYWMKAPGSQINWQDINYFHNDFSAAVGELLFGSRSATSETGSQIATGNQALDLKLDLNIPDNTSDGVQPKRWMIIDKVRCLVKGGGFLNQEPYNELIATRLYQRLLQPDEYVPYALHKDEGKDSDGICSLCPNMLADDEEFVPAAYIDLILPYADGEDSLNHYLRCCRHLGVDAHASLSKMLVCDYLLANHDRHYRNFGLIRNVDSLSWRLAPLFDSGSSLWCDVRSLRPDNLGYRSYPFIGDPLLQLELVRDYSWYDPERLVGFTAELVGILKEGALHDYGMRLITIEDAIDERIDKLVDIYARQSPVAPMYNLAAEVHGVMADARVFLTDDDLPSRDEMPRDSAHTRL